GSKFSENYGTLTKDLDKPLYNRPVMALYPPGSIFKIVQSLIGLQDGVLTPNTTYACNRSLVACHNHPSPTNLFEAIRNSCNPYYHQAFRQMINKGVSSNTYIDTQIGLDQWREAVMKFGLGTRLGIDMNGEQPGSIPGSALYNRIYGEGRWRDSTIYSLSIGQGELLVTPSQMANLSAIYSIYGYSLYIGQGELLVTPLQMANLSAIFANKGYYYPPHLIKAIDGDSTKIPEKYRTRIDVGVDAHHFDMVQDAMAEALYGTAQRAII